MYTLVLAALLTTGNELPDRGGCRGGCHGCRGGCWGGCMGCWGGCMGCWGGCMGCYGGCYGCWGGGFYSGCWGCYGCSGGCFGCYGCGGGMAVMSGGCMGAGAGGAGAQGGGGAGAQGGGAGAQGKGGSGAQGGGGGSGAQQGGGGGSTQTSLQDLKKSVDDLKKEQTQIRIDALKLTADELRRKETDQKIDELRREINNMKLRVPPPPPPGGVPPKIRRELPAPQPGKVFLDMPADALVFVNDTRIESASASSYLTQPLESGKEYVLNIEAVAVRDGQNINRTKSVTIRSGEEVRLAYKDMDLADARSSRAGASAASSAQITVRLPADARLTVHGVDCPLASDTRTFDTPPLAPGQKYYYLLKAEVVRDGRTIAQTRRIDFRSGERVTVSFDNLGANVVSAR